MERGKQIYNNQYEKWMPWVEDQYLYYFGKDNKASYATKDTLNKTQVSGIEPVDKLQGGLTDTVAGQIGKGGALESVGNAASKQGVNRAERGGKDDKGSYGGPMGGVMDGAVDSAKSAGTAASDGAKSAGGYLGGWFGGKGEQKK